MLVCVPSLPIKAEGPHHLKKMDPKLPVSFHIISCHRWMLQFCIETWHLSTWQVYLLFKIEVCKDLSEGSRDWNVGTLPPKQTPMKSTSSTDVFSRTCPHQSSSSL